MTAHPHGAGPDRWADAMRVLQLFAVDPAGLGGVALRALPGPVRDGWLRRLTELLPVGTPIRRLPLHITDGRLLGGLDLTATLAAGRPVGERGLLAEADGGVVLATMAERLAAGTAAKLAAVMDRGQVTAERDGLALSSVARIGIVALDEGVGEDEQPPPALTDRLAFLVDLDGVAIGDMAEAGSDAGAIVAARASLDDVAVSPELVEALCAAASAMGIGSLRAPLLALRAARAVAALDRRGRVETDDAAWAARLVLAPRSTVPPVLHDETAETSPPQPPDAGDSCRASESPEGPASIEDVVVAAARAAIPARILAKLRLGEAGAARKMVTGGAGKAGQSPLRGRPVGIRAGEPGRGARLNLVATLRAAAPWQPLRRSAGSDRIEVRRGDFRFTRYKQRTRTTVIFLVDASGSAALHRLAEAKGAVELLLADCYVRRDRVALLAFRGRRAELLLAPTRSLVRARRSLADLPGGGGTPLASGIRAGLDLAEAVRRRGETPVLILLTDGRANVGLDGEPGRARAETEALAASRPARACGITSLIIDTSPQPRPQGARLAAEMGALYLPLPHADAARLSQAVREGAFGRRSGRAGPS